MGTPARVSRPRGARISSNMCMRLRFLPGNRCECRLPELPKPCSGRWPWQAKVGCSAFAACWAEGDRVHIKGEGKNRVIARQTNEKVGPHVTKTRRSLMAHQDEQRKSYRVPERREIAPHIYNEWKHQGGSTSRKPSWPLAGLAYATRDYYKTSTTKSLGRANR